MRKHIYHLLNLISVGLATQIRIYSLFRRRFSNAQLDRIHIGSSEIYFFRPVCIYQLMINATNRLLVGGRVCVCVCIEWGPCASVCQCTRVWLLECFNERRSYTKSSKSKQNRDATTIVSYKQTIMEFFFSHCLRTAPPKKNINCKFINLWNHLNTLNGINENEVIWRFCFRVNVGGGGNWTVWIKISAR